MNQEIFLKKTQFDLLANLSEATTPQWGIMTAQEMVEHLSTLFLFTLEKVVAPSFYDEATLQKKYKMFIEDKQSFSKNIKIKGLEKPLPLKYKSIEEATEKLKALVTAFFVLFETEKGKRTMHPAFGNLNFEDWLQIHYTHARHHLLQFGLIDAV